MHQNRWRWGSAPDPAGELTALPRPLAVRREGRGGEGRGLCDFAPLPTKLPGYATGSYLHLLTYLLCSYLYLLTYLLITCLIYLSTDLLTSRILTYNYIRTYLRTYLGYNIYLLLNYYILTKTVLVRARFAGGG